MNWGPLPIGVGTGGGSLPYVVEPQPAATAARKKKRRRVHGRWATVSPLPLHPLRGFRPGSECIENLRGGVGQPFSMIDAGPAAPKLSFGYTFARARRRSSVG